MNNIKEILNKYAFIPQRYTIKKNATIIDTDDGHFVFKKKDPNNVTSDILKYLKSRNFSYLPNLIDSDNHYDVYDYIDDVATPREQKALDMMFLLSMLHNKTTFYKDADEDDYKAIYEDMIKKIDYIYNYYSDIIATIEERIYMSPSEYLIARNITKIFDSIAFSRREIDSWYELVKNKQKKRVVTTHNNLDLDHILHNENLYLISWDKARQDMPLYDFLDFYNRYALEFDFDELLKIYESKYPLLEDERSLLFIMMSLPKKLDYHQLEMDNCKEARKMLDYVYKTEKLLTPYYAPNDDKEQN